MTNTELLETIASVEDEARHAAFYKNFRKWAKLVADVFAADSEHSYVKALIAIGYEGLLAPLSFATKYAEELHYVIGQSYATVAIANGIDMDRVAPPDDTPPKLKQAWIRGIGDVRKVWKEDERALPLRGLDELTKKKAVNYAFALYSAVYFAEQGGNAWNLAKEITFGDEGKLHWPPRYPAY